MSKCCFDLFIFTLISLFPYVTYGQIPSIMKAAEINSPTRVMRFSSNLHAVSTTTSNGSIGGAIDGSGGKDFNVKAYGAVGNGINNDTRPIQAANKAAEAVHGQVYFPTGIYMITSTIHISSPVTWRGANAASNSNGSGGPLSSVVIEAGAALDPMINIGHSNVTIVDIRIDGNEKAIEGIRTQTSGREPRAYNVVLRHVAIQNFPLSNPSVIGLDLGDYDDSTNQYACSDCVLEDVEVFSGPDYQQGKKAAGVGVYISREENQFYAPKIAGWDIGVLLGGGKNGEASDNGFFGGFIGDDKTADISLTAEAIDVQNSYYNVWFEGSSGPIVGAIPQGKYTDQLFSFWGCHFNTYSNRSIFDLTNMVGSVDTYDSSFDISNSGHVIVSNLGRFSAYNDPFTNSLTFTGSNYSISGAPIKGSVSMGTNTIGPGACGDQRTYTGPGVSANRPVAVNQNTANNGALTLVHWANATPEIVFKWCNTTKRPVIPNPTRIYFTQY